MRTRTARRSVRVCPRLSRIATVTVVVTVRTPRARIRRSVVDPIDSANVRRPAAVRRRVTRTSRVERRCSRRWVVRLTVIVAVAWQASEQPTVNVARPRTREVAIAAVGRANACVGAVPLPGWAPPPAGAGAAGTATTVTVDDVTNVFPPRKSVAPTRGWKVPGVAYGVRRTGVVVRWSNTPSPLTSQL